MYNRAVLLNLPKFQSVDIEFTNVVYDVQCGFRGSTKQILKGISGLFKCGDLTAIMGPSGAGKSTLLNLLTGYNQKENLKNQIKYINSKGKRETWKNYRKQSCYIQQDDQFYGLFTINEAMMISCDLKMGHSLNTKAKQMLIDEILETLDLTGSKQTRCDKLSGGQKKRLSIALELVDNPPVMFLDEPTTGLDSLSSLQCVSMLQNLAKSGRTIVCTIHQPSATIYEMFDHVYLLADGRCMYEGSSKNTVVFFANLGLNCPKYHNPADYVIEVITKEYGDFNDQLSVAMEGDRSIWRNENDKKVTTLENNLNNSLPSNEGKTTVLINSPSEITRFLILLNRCFVLFYRDWTVMYLKVILHLFVGVLLGLLFENAGAEGSKSINNVGFFLVTIVYLCYTSMMPAVLRFPLELAILKKERFNNWYQIRTYYFALLIANIPVQLSFAMAYTSFSYFLSNQPLVWNRFLMFLSISILTTFIADSYGLLIGTLLNPVNGTFAGAISTCTFLVFAGFLAMFKDMPRYLYYCSYLSYLRYSFDGLVQAIYGFNRDKLACLNNIYCHYSIPRVILEELSLTDGKYWIDIVVLIGYFILLRIIAYCMLKRKLLQA